MLKIETANQFLGFGNGQKPGEYFYSQNMAQGRFGLDAYSKLAGDTSSGTLSGLGRMQGFAEYGGSPYAISEANKLYFISSGSWSDARTSTQTGIGNGLITDQKGRLLYAQNQYLGMYNGGWTDNWKDLVTSVADYRPMDTYEEWVLIGHDNAIALLNTNDDSLNLAGFTLPTGFRVRAIRSNRTGILVGANVGNRSIIFLWDALSDRSIAPWIWSNYKVQSICKAGGSWIVTTTKSRFVTDGYSITPLPNAVDSTKQSQDFNVIPDGTTVIDRKLLTMHTDLSVTMNRHKSGLYELDLDTGLETYVTASNGCTADMTMGAVFQDSQFRTFAAYSTNLPSVKYIDQLKNDLPSRAVLIAGPFGGSPNMKIAEGVQVLLTEIANHYTVYPTMSFDVSVKVYASTRTLWGYAQQIGTGTATNKLNVNGTSSGFNNAQVGDEVTILSGQNAGQIRHITAIASEGSNPETWTLDSALSNLTETTALIQVMPFKLVKKYTMTSITELKDLYFDIKNRPKGKRFLVKVVLENIDNAPISINAVGFLYDEKGIK